MVEKSIPIESMEAAKGRNDATTPDRRGSFIALRFAGHWFPEPIRGKFEVSET
jgi:hypothetical protein